MESKDLNNLEQTLYDTVKELAEISPMVEGGEKYLVNELLKIFNSHYKLIDYLESNANEIIEIKKIKKDKTYLKKYILAFEQNLKLYDITNDTENKNKMLWNILVFELFMEDIEVFYKLQSSIYTFFLANPDNKQKYQILKNSDNCFTEKEKQFINIYETHKYLKSLFKFFRCYTLTKKNIMTSLSIKLYKMLIKTEVISKYQIKEILETMFFKLDAATTIRVDEMDKTYIKTVVDGLVISAYPSTNDIQSLLNFEEINKKLSKRLEKYENNQLKKTRLKNYIQTKISPLQAKLS
ncbi:MAG: hypothetical protein AB7E13_10245 [Arcobacteraceae bacterium]|jgi:hypothetical protein